MEQLGYIKVLVSILSGIEINIDNETKFIARCVKIENY